MRERRIAIDRNRDRGRPAHATIYDRAVEILLFFFDLISRSSSTRRCFMMRF
jgi:hypothetical protein